ncbi:MAG: hypothetical protein ACJ79W_25915, partial [Myxococcales bacterium]
MLRFGYPGDDPTLGGAHSVNLIERLSKAPGATPPAAAFSHKPERVVLLADATSPLPLSILGAIRSGGIQLVAQGPINDSYGADFRTMPLLPHVVARMREEELDPSIEPDASVPAKRGAGSDQGLD